MAILDSLQRRLDSGFNRNMRSFDDTALDGMDQPDSSPQDMMAFNEAMMKVASSSTAASEEMQMKHNLTKSIIDGAQ
ncbi:hypothetical protein BFW87_23975 [Pseudomonas fluorescens]|uniref:HrpF protein n=1 Tax=Pseudomonas fluorescens TaxID=294 RepID=A0A1T2Y5Y3_PSEFL|nr:hypothetical protein [Pseudomonas fluorescens]OPA87501.1 hypothetical protein BFW87_23975 [Pseudomonas fluorescens]